MIRWAKIYANTEVLSPIDRDTWRVIAETSRITAKSRVLELASGKGAFANYLAKTFGCMVDGFDINPEFIDYSNRRAIELGLQARVKFSLADINWLQVSQNSYDLGVCLGALYIFRESGWKAFITSVKPQGYLAVSDLVCQKVPPPKEIKGTFFEEPGEPMTIDSARQWYTSRGAKIIREIECSQTAWLDYYDLTKEMLTQISKRQDVSKELLEEVEEGLREDRLVRKYREQYLSYITFVLRKS